MKKLLMIFITIFSIVGIVGIMYAFKNHTTILNDQFKYMLDGGIKSEEDRIWGLLAQHRINKQEILQEAERRNPAIINTFPDYKDLPSASPATKKFIEDTLVSIDIDPQTVKILQRDQSCTACNVGTMIIVNEKLFNKHSKSAQRFMIIHECGHMLERDGIVKNIVTVRLNPGMNDIELAKKYPNHPLCQLMRFLEWRADVFALTHAQNTAYGYDAFCAENIKWWGVGFHIPTHPSYSDRLKVAQLAQHNLQVA